MKSAIFAILGIVGFGQLAMAGWDTRVVPKMSGVDGDRYVMIYEPDADRGTKAIAASLDALLRAGHLSALQTMTIHKLVQDETFQREVFQQMETIAPEILKSARRSAGNMHNPKMIELHDTFTKAVMASPTVVALNQALGKHQMKISRPSFEKLELHRNGDSEAFWCFLWLTVEPESSPSSQKP